MLYVKVFQDVMRAKSAIVNPAELTGPIPPIVAAAVRICGRESQAAIGFLTKGHPYYITMHMKKIILPATLTPPGLPVYIFIANVFVTIVHRKHLNTIYDSYVIYCQ